MPDPARPRVFSFRSSTTAFRHHGEPRIKAIIIYPMNAQATDQSRRLAQFIHQNRNTRGGITAGLFVGRKDAEIRNVMTPDGVITDRSALRLQPPDILLTNCKMLDYLPIRSLDFPLWRETIRRRSGTLW